MYVCICNSVTETDIADAVRDGARTVDCLTAELNVSTCCGQCRPVVDDCLQAALQAHSDATPAEPLPTEPLPTEPLYADPVLPTAVLSFAT